MSIVISPYESSFSQAPGAGSAGLLAMWAAAAEIFPQLSPIADWNDPDTQPYNDCYNFACGIETGTFAEAGIAGGYTPTTILPSEYIQAAAGDGLISGVDPDDFCGTPCLPNGHIVALAIWPGADFHWRRMESNGTSSHKPGRTAATTHDISSKPIYDPRTADLGNNTEFSGFFCLGAGVNMQ